MSARRRTGMEIMSQHPRAYRSGEWALIVGTNYQCDHDNPVKGCYQLRWPDGDTDDWAIIDPDAEYQFREIVAKS